ncbi:MAG: TIGR03960 family B12-binding radical SAM protein [bacterium]
MMDGLFKKVTEVLPLVSRPGRYVGNELHAVKKDWEQTDVHFALAFPDAYEIGMSHIGLKILYHILNRCDWVAAERVFSPWVDMEEKMREAGIPLFSLESKRPIGDFDVLGITLQYELQYTNVLNLIDLSKIPLRSEERGEKDPLVIAGGPCAFNPEPLAEFLDAVVLGDGEEAVMEIAHVVREAKAQGRSRAETLKAFSGLNGVYVPSFYRVESASDGRYLRTIPAEEGVEPRVAARILDRLSPENYPDRPVVPLIEVTHDRFSLEIMRGCTRGCRFCSAGMGYRPVRERDVEDLVTQTKAAVTCTGYDEVSLVSLSTSDYCHLSELLPRLKEEYRETGISISFPSLRPDSFTPEMADFGVGLRRSGLTLAPEAGTQRLRDTINKNQNEEDLLRAVDIAFQRGWKRIKLYFMIGLPTETEEDLEGIVDIVGKVIQSGRKYGKREVHVSISPFTPKPHTPFQWEAQDSLDLSDEKISILKRAMKWREVALSWRDPHVSRLEAILGRGDRRLGEAVYRAWKRGARFDAWSDQFNYSRWERVFGELNIVTEDYTAEKRVDDPLPWDHLSKGLSKSFLIQERNRAYSAEVTGDCRFTGCKGCGLMAHPVCREVIGGAHKVEGTGIRMKVEYGRRARRVPQDSLKRRVRLGYCKGEEVRFTSHLDTVRVFSRALRRARVPVALSQGFHAHLRIATGPPLSLGFTSRAEYLDLEVVDSLLKNFEEVMNRHLPEGFEVFEHGILLDKAPSLNESINLASYDIVWDGAPSTDALTVRIDELLKKNSFRVVRTKKGEEKEVDIRVFIVDVLLNDNRVELWLRLSPQGTARVEEVVRAIFPYPDEPPPSLRIERTGLYIERRGQRLNPLQVE